MLEASALHARWKVEDREGDALCNDEVVFRRTESVARILPASFSVIRCMINRWMQFTPYSMKSETCSFLPKRLWEESYLSTIFLSCAIISNRSVTILIPLELLHTRGHSTDG